MLLLKRIHTKILFQSPSNSKKSSSIKSVVKVVSPVASSSIDAVVKEVCPVTYSLPICSKNDWSKYGYLPSCPDNLPELSTSIFSAMSSLIYPDQYPVSNATIIDEFSPTNLSFSSN